MEGWHWGPMGNHSHSSLPLSCMMPGHCMIELLPECSNAYQNDTTNVMIPSGIATQLTYLEIAFMEIRKSASATDSSFLFAKTKAFPT